VLGGRVGDGARSLLDKEETSPSTNLPLEDLLDGKAWIAFRYDGEDLEASMVARRGCWCPTCTS
jgi:hypothetical protein